MRKAKCNKNSLEKNMEAVKDKPLSTWPVDTTVVKSNALFSRRRLGDKAVAARLA